MGGPSRGLHEGCILAPFLIVPLEIAVAVFPQVRQTTIPYSEKRFLPACMVAMSAAGCKWMWFLMFTIMLDTLSDSWRAGGVGCIVVPFCE